MFGKGLGFQELFLGGGPLAEFVLGITASMLILTMILGFFLLDDSLPSWGKSLEIAARAALLAGKMPHVIRRIVGGRVEPNFERTIR